jgi:hypothetical protein
MLRLGFTGRLQNGETAQLFVVCIHFPDDPAGSCSARIDADDPETILAEAANVTKDAVFAEKK